MDSLLEKFYNGGSLQSRNGFTRFSAFHPNSSMNVGLAPATKSPLPVRPLISTVNSTNININHKPNLTINTNYNNLVTNNNLAFNSSSDLLYNNPGYTHKRYNSEYNIRNNTVADIKRNDTKMQMMEEKKEINFEDDFISNPKNIQIFKDLKVDDAYNIELLDNTFWVFKSITEILYLIYANRKNSIICYNLINDQIINEIKNPHDNQEIINFRYFLDKNNKRDLIISYLQKIII